MIEARPKEVATDTDNWENEPAYLRRNMKFVKDSVTEGSRPSRVVLKDEDRRVTILRTDRCLIDCSFPESVTKDNSSVKL